MSAQKPSPSDPEQRPAASGPTSEASGAPASSSADPMATTTAVPADPTARATWWLTGSSIVVVGALVATAVFLSGGGRSADGSAGASASEASFEPADPGLVGELIKHTSTAHEGLVPVVEAMDEFLPTDGSHPPLDMTEASVVNTWRTDVQEVGSHFADPPSGGTSHDVAHAGLSSSVRLLASAVQTYATAALVEDEDLRMDVLHIAMDQRDQAVRSWSVAATQLDLVSVDTGHGHVHLYLPASPDSGALEPDGAEEGAGAEEGTETGSSGGHDDH